LVEPPQPTRSIGTIKIRAESAIFLTDMPVPSLGILRAGTMLDVPLGAYREATRLTVVPSGFTKSDELASRRGLFCVNFLSHR
jgi:hypothetical protein